MNRNGEYWKERFRQMEEAQHDTSAAKAKEMQEQFERAQAAIEGKINAWYQRLANNNGVSMQEARKMLSEKELKEFRWNVNDYIKYAKDNAITGQWEKQLENVSARVHISRLEALKLETQHEAEKAYGNVVNAVNKHIQTTYMSDYYHTAYEIQRGIGVGANLHRLNPVAVEKIVSKPWAVDGKNFSDRLWESKTKFINNIHNSLSRMCITGEGPDRAIKEIAKAMNVSKAQAARVVMTESAAFASRARHDCMKELDVEQFEVVETLDGSTCEVCGGMDGQHFPLSDFAEGVTAPPFHPNCRGCTCPYFEDDLGQTGERAARDKETGETYYVPGNMGYKDWKESFVEGENKKGLQKVKNDVDTEKGANYNVIRSGDELKAVVQEVKGSISNYANNASKWSGKVLVDNSLAEEGVMGRKEWSCDITLIDSVDNGAVWHEMLHSCSASYYNEQVYGEHQAIEEASVEFLKQQICKERRIKSVAAYEECTGVLQALNDKFHYGTDMDFAKELFNIPLPNRYQWLEDKVDESLRAEKASFEDYNDVLLYIKILEGGL